MGAYCFKNCTALTTATVGGHAYEYCFSGCTALTTATVGGDAYGYCFSGCTALTEATVGGSAGFSYSSSSRGYCFKDCTALTTATVGGYAYGNCFSGCTALTTATVGAGVNSTAFTGCKKLQTLTLGGDVGANAFSGLTSLKSVTFLNGVRSIGESAFTGCTGLTSVTLSNTVTSIGTSAFASCKGLTSFVCGKSLTSVGINAFRGCSALKSVSFPEGIKTIMNYAFTDCGKLETVYYVGSKAQWDEVSIGDGNEKLKNATFREHAGGYPCTVTFVSNGGSEVKTQTVRAGECAKKPTNPTREDYAFVCWTLNDSYYATEYDFSTPVTDDVTLYARWAESGTRYTVSFQSNGGSYVEEQRVSLGKRVVRPKDPTREGWIVVCWSTDNSSVSYVEYDFTRPVTGDFTLYAMWRRDNGEPTITGYVDGTTLSFTVRNAPDGARVIAARYNKEGKLTCIRTAAVKGGVESSFTMSGSGTEYRLMLVDKNSTPLCAAWSN